jgi:hypothetical protein
MKVTCTHCLGAKRIGIEPCPFCVDPAKPNNGPKGFWVVNPCNECQGSGGWKPCWECELGRRSVQEDVDKAREEQETQQLNAALEMSRKEKERLDLQTASGGESSRTGAGEQASSVSASKGKSRAAAEGSSGSQATPWPDVKEQSEYKPSRKGKERAREADTVRDDDE